MSDVQDQRLRLSALTSCPCSSACLPSLAKLAFFTDQIADLELSTRLRSYYRRVWRSIGLLNALREFKLTQNFA
jgi:hypothetical protein